MLSFEIQSSTFVPRTSSCGCNHDQIPVEIEHKCECGGNCKCGEWVEVDSLISELAELALIKNYANVEDFAHYIAQETINRVRHHSQHLF
ncbi:MAG: hypothetical protein RIT27_1426 [Pseudomonadota bacterium]|jgi:hypothetical protein